jgi:hypothetical protein
LPTAKPKPTGTQIRFELVLANGVCALRGEGAVVSARQEPPAGMGVGFNAVSPCTFADCALEGFDSPYPGAPDATDNVLSAPDEPGVDAVGNVAPPLGSGPALGVGWPASSPSLPSNVPTSAAMALFGTCRGPVAFVGADASIAIESF